MVADACRRVKCIEDAFYNMRCMRLERVLIWGRNSNYRQK